MCPGPTCPSQLAAAAVHRRCTPVDRGPYSKRGTAREKNGRNNRVMSDLNGEDVLSQQAVPIRHLFPIASHLQDVAAVVFRESALFLVTGRTLTFDTDVLPKQTHKLITNEIKETSNKQCSDNNFEEKRK